MRLLLVSLLFSLASPGAAQTGILVMAHGGSDEWNAQVLDVVDPLRSEYPLAVAFGMADPRTMKAASDSLIAQGVERIFVARLFLSGESFLGATKYILGLSDVKPQWTMHADHMHQLATPVPVLLSEEGLLDAPEVGGILRARVEALSRDPSREAVLLLAHGAESEEENDSWLARMDALSDSVRLSDAYGTVHVETLREDWDEERAIAEARIQQWVSDEARAGLDVIVVPFRLSGFGPYAEVLDGLEYRSDGLGLLPDDRIADWIRRQVHRIEAVDES